MSGNSQINESKEYWDAIAEYEKFVEAGTDNTEEAIQAFLKVIKHASPEARKRMHDVADKFNLAPQNPSGYTDDGTPVYSVSDIAKHFNKSEEQVLKEMQMFAEGMGQPLINGEKVNPIH